MVAWNKLGDVFDRATDLYPDEVALVDDKGLYAYGWLREKVEKLAISLNKSGIWYPDPAPQLASFIV